MIFEKVKELLAKQFRIDANTITEETSILEDIGADSLDIVEMLMTLEEKFKISVPDEDVVKLKTVGEVVKYIESKI